MTDREAIVRELFEKKFGPKLVVRNFEAVAFGLACMDKQREMDAPLRTLCETSPTPACWRRDHEPVSM